MSVVLGQYDVVSYVDANFLQLFSSKGLEQSTRCPVSSSPSSLGGRWGREDQDIPPEVSGI